MKIKGHNFTIGADPEVFVKRYGKLSSAYGLIPGTKDDPFIVKNGAVQVDGMALEFNIDPAATLEQFQKNMSTVLDQMTKMVPGYELFIQPVADFGFDYINGQPKEAKELGCNPDFNAYTMKPNPRPDADTPFRTASGHIHIGWREEPVDPQDATHLEACQVLVQALDLYVGLPLMCLDPDNRRRQLYGKAGAFRPKSYGLEYRVPSNVWIGKELTRAFVFGNTVKAIEAVFENPDVGLTKLNGYTAKEVIDNWDGVRTAQVDAEGNMIDGTAHPYEMAVLEAFSYHNVPSFRDYLPKEV